MLAPYVYDTGGCCATIWRFGAVRAMSSIVPKALMLAPYVYDTGGCCAATAGVLVVYCKCVGTGLHWWYKPTARML